ncbi:MAG: ferric reductase-like transmembrane domain-containing protein [Candidatus Eremiobacteraeota bacterium]|nr:ferric reductase-like transmembrane domain-containing protein [Candidatus Eremiobacteraeota bacterium]
MKSWRAPAAIFLLIVFIAAPLIMIFLWHGNLAPRIENDQTNALMELGRLAALMGVYLLMVQLLLIGRVWWIERVFGLDHLAQVHHLNGLLIIPLLCAHPLLLAFGYATRDGRGFIDQYKDFLTWDSVIPAGIGLGLLFLSVFFSLGVLRKKLKYETWLAFHLLAYVALALAFLHQVRTGNDLIDSTALLAFWYGLYGFCLGNLVLFRFIKPVFSMARFGFTVDRIEHESSDVASVYIKGKNLDKFHYSAGQFAIVRFLGGSFILEAHPFSLSSTPGSPFIRFSIKSSGDFTARVPSLPPGMKVCIDGPHGVFTADTLITSKVLLVAGGIGITPLRGLAEAFLREGKEVTLLYSTRAKNGIVFKEELDELAKAHRTFSLHYIVSDDPSWEGEKGRIDSEKIKRLVKDPPEHDAYVCGPPPMMKGLVKLLESEGIRKSAIHYERFAL